MRIIFFGDVIGKIGRRAMQQAVPIFRTEFSPDFVVANVENIAHGAGVTKKTLQELIDAGVDFFTSGNHVLAKAEAADLLNDSVVPLIRPANFPDNTPGRGYRLVEIGSRRVLFINLLGQVFIKEEASNPFTKFDQIMAQYQNETLAAVMVDFHAEATSEKIAFGHYVDGRVSAVLGTHTHVPTADAKILAGGTAYVSDVGMVGAADSVIGDSKELIIEGFLQGRNPRIDVPESGTVEVGAMLIDIDPVHRSSSAITRVDKKIKV